MLLLDLSSCSNSTASEGALQYLQQAVCMYEGVCISKRLVYSFQADKP